MASGSAWPGFAPLLSALESAPVATVLGTVAVVAVSTGVAYVLVGGTRAPGGEPQEHTSRSQLALDQLRDRCSTSYDTGDAAHEERLEALWNALRPGVRRTARLTEEWGELGFQGQDPATDFRGYGMLGLDNLLYFATSKYSSVMRGAVNGPRWPEDPFGLPVAITGINLTAKLLTLLRSSPRATATIFDELFDLYPNAEENGTMPQHLVVERFSEVYVQFFIDFMDFHRREVRAYLDRGGAPHLAAMQVTQVTEKFYTHHARHAGRNGRLHIALRR